jgi:hypothetical protein
MNINLMKQVTMIIIASLPLYTAGCAAGDEDELAVGDELVDGEKDAVVGRNTIWAIQLPSPIIDLTRLEVYKDRDWYVLSGTSRGNITSLHVSVVSQPYSSDATVKKVSTSVLENYPATGNSLVFKNDGRLVESPGAAFKASGLTRFPAVLSFLQRTPKAKEGCVGMVTAAMAAATPCSASTTPSPTCAGLLRTLAAKVDACK